MGFIDSYKRLEKLCGEQYNTNHGISSYIDEMKNTPIGSRYVAGWDDDLKQLKHYRWVRNQIVHNPDCTEENMCQFGDAQWLDNFHSRIMAVNDPLSLCHKAQKSQPTQKPRQTHVPEARPYTHTQRTSPPRWYMDCIPYIICAFIVVVAILLIVVALV